MARPVRVARWALAVFLALVTALLVVASVGARFTRGELLDTDRYVATVAPLAYDPVVQQAVADRVTTEAVAAIPVEDLVTRAGEGIGLPEPEKIAELAAPAISSWLSGQIHRIVEDFVTSPTFPAVWQNLNRTAHRGLEAALTGETGDLVDTENGTITVDLGVVLAAVKQELVQRGIGLAARIPDVSIPYAVAQIDELPQLQRAVRMLQAAATWLPIAALVMLGLAVWAAPNHRRGLILALLFSAGAVSIALLANQLARLRVADEAAARGIDVTLGMDVYDTLARFLLAALATILAAAALGIVWALLSGPSAVARSFRSVVNRGTGGVASLTDTEGTAAVGAFVRRWYRGFAVALGVLAILVLLARPTVAWAVAVFVVTAVVVLVLQVMAHWGTRGTDADTVVQPPGPPLGGGPSTGSA